MAKVRILFALILRLLRLEIVCVQSLGQSREAAMERCSFLGYRQRGPEPIVRCRQPSEGGFFTEAGKERQQWTQARPASLLILPVTCASIFSAETLGWTMTIVRTQSKNEFSRPSTRVR
jgi:hypothetical protein